MAKNGISKSKQKRMAVDAYMEEHGLSFKVKGDVARAYAAVLAKIRQEQHASPSLWAAQTGDRQHTG